MPTFPDSETIRPSRRSSVPLRYRRGFHFGIPSLFLRMVNHSLHNILLLACDDTGLERVTVDLHMGSLNVREGSNSLTHTAAHETQGIPERLVYPIATGHGAARAYYSRCPDPIIRFPLLQLAAHLPEANAANSSHRPENRATRCVDGIHSRMELGAGKCRTGPEQPHTG